MTRPARRGAVLALIVPAALLAFSACQGEKKAASGRTASQKDIDDVRSLLSDTAGGVGRSVPRVGPELPPNVVFTRDDIPNEGGYLQIQIGDITDAQANRFLRRAKTEMCTCGCPHTIDQCLIEDPQCDVARRLAAQILRESLVAR